MTLNPTKPGLNRHVEVALWLLLAAITFVSFLGRNVVLSSFEARVVQTSTSMSRSGWPWQATPIDVPRVELQQGPTGSHLVKSTDGATLRINPWLVPVFEGEIRLQKPPLPYWTTAILFRIFGDGPGVARFPTALLGVIACALCYRLALHVAGRRVAIVTLALAVSSFFLIDEYRKSMADPYLACLTLAATVAWIEASNRESRTARSWLVVAFYILLALASLAKGPVAFLHVGVALAAYSYALRRRPRASSLAHVGGLIIYAAIALPWPLYIITHVPSALEIWRFESIGEFSDNQRNARPFFYYLPNLLLIAAPWTILWLASAGDFFKRRSRRRSFVWIWLLITLLIFSCSHMKKNAYLLPVVPAITIATAQVIVRMFAIARRKPADKTIAWAAAAHWVAGFAFAIVIAISSFKWLSGVVPFVVTIASVGFALIPLRSLKRREFERWFKLQSIAFSLLIITFLSFPESAHRSRSRSTDDASTAKRLPVELAQAGLPSQPDER